MNPQVTAILLGVADLDRSRKFYGEGLGCPIDKDYPVFVSFKLGDGSSELGLYTWEALAQDAGVAPEGSGFRGVTLNYIVDAPGRVDEVLAMAAKAGGAIIRPAQGSQWGGYFGYFADPDGHLWKVAASAG